MALLAFSLLASSSAPEVVQRPLLDLLGDFWTSQGWPGPCCIGGRRRIHQTLEAIRQGCLLSVDDLPGVPHLAERFAFARAAKPGPKITLIRLKKLRCSSLVGFCKLRVPCAVPASAVCLKPRPHSRLSKPRRDLEAQEASKWND
ncbi:hypothetical protein QBC47DRAFT_357277 [Echria macrotheca]|uniref:Uncharacterized protein n=1 Tax=Echria macrotheca TaxID=438768 RepID=A0AAJ0BJI4_9PEZI|nr:hypothetical protein QBC47DRAFT_357277 [Echria macrotheca]